MATLGSSLPSECAARDSRGLTAAPPKTSIPHNGERRTFFLRGGRPSAQRAGRAHSQGRRAMAIFLSKRELAQTEPAERVAFRSPVPTRIVSNGEFNPLPETRRQRQFEERLKDLAEAHARKLGMDRRHFLRTSCGMAT